MQGAIPERKIPLKENNKPAKRVDIGGQAVLEGVMMRSPEYIALAVRRPDGSVVCKRDPYVSPAKKHKWMGWPFVRGAVSMVTMLGTGMKTLEESSKMGGVEDEQPTKFELWLAKKLGKGVDKVVMGLAIVLAVVLQLFLNRTRPGLNLRSVGENPATADAAGINVSRNKYLATCVGAGVSGLGGLYYTMDYIKGTWANDGTIESLGWLAVALVIFATWRTVNAIWGSYLFGLLFWVYLIIPGLGRRDTYLFNMLPYLVTIAVLIFVSLRNKKENQPPASLGLAYFREER